MIEMRYDDVNKELRFSSVDDGLCSGGIGVDDDEMYIWIEEYCARLDMDEVRKLRDMCNICLGEE